MDETFMKARRIGRSPGPVTFAREPARAGLAAARSLASKSMRPAMSVADAYLPDAPIPATWFLLVVLALIGSVPFAVALGRSRRTLGSMA